MQYVPKSDADLEQLAQDIVAGMVFHSSYHADAIEKSGLSLASIFMPLMFIEDWNTFAQEHNIAVVYEHYEKAGPRSCNGMPCFFSCGCLNGADAERLHARVLEIDTFKRSRMQAATAES